MPPVVVDVRAAEDLRDVVHRAVQAVAEGKLVVFPTETDIISKPEMHCSPGLL